MEIAELLDRGRAAFATYSWSEAYDALGRAELNKSSEPADLELLATAAYLTGHDVESTVAWTWAHRAWHERGDEQRAARCAFWLGFGLVQRGEMAQGGGWLARAGRLVEEYELDTVERGYLLVPQGLVAMGSGEPDTALARFAEAESLARRFDDRDLSTLGRLGQGQALLCLGRIAEGLHRFDEAMVAVTAGETSPVISGLVYCRGHRQLPPGVRPASRPRVDDGSRSVVRATTRSGAVSGAVPGSPVPGPPDPRPVGRCGRRRRAGSALVERSASPRSGDGALSAR